jgi:hypothetical protein
MRWFDLGLCRGVLEIDYGSPFSTAVVGAELELLVWWGGGVPSRAAWCWSQTGKVAAWAWVGQA